MDIGSIELRSSVSQEQVTNHQFIGFTKDGKKIVRETSEDGVVSVKIDPEGEKADAERTKKLREIMQKVYAGTKLSESELAFLRANYPDTYQSVVEKEKTGRICATARGAAKPTSSTKDKMTAFSSGLKQAVAEAEKGAVDTAAWKLDTTTRLERIGNYTKEDALRRAWDAQQPTVRIDLTGQGTVQGAEGWRPSALQSAETMQDFEAQLQAEGLSAKLDDKYWANLAGDLRAVKYDANTSAITTTGEDFQRKVDYLASRAAAAEAVIKYNLGGKEQEVQRLNETISGIAKEIAASYSETVGSFLEQNGVSGETSKIYDSVLRGIEAKTDAYRSALTDSKELADLKGTSDQWLLQDDAYVASVLRSSGDTPKQESDAVYTIDDLATLGQFTSELASVERSTDLYSMDEERMGLDLAMLSMKTDAMQKSGTVSAAMSQTLQRAADGYKDAFLNRMNARLEKAQNVGAAAGDKKGFAALDKNAVQNVYSRTMRYYKTIGNALQALQKGAEFGLKQRTQKAAQTSGIYRYTNSASYWDSFFQKGDEKDSAYQATGVTFNNYAAGWNDFAGSLNGKGAVRLNLALRPADYYGNGNQVDAWA